MANHNDVLRMEADLRLSVTPPVWPAGVTTTTWQGSAEPAVHRLLQSAYSRGGGEVAEDYAKWLREFTADTEFDPSSCILAWAGPELAGAALCWSSAFLKDLCVAEWHRGQGLGEALVRAAMIVFADRGAPALALKVQADNPSGALRLYLRSGFKVVERIPPRLRVVSE
jgi:ribosomal protein S18 acetylase RimI-like enzyme